MVIINIICNNTYYFTTIYISYSFNGYCYIFNYNNTYNITDTKITDRAVPILSEMKRLQFLTLSEKQIGKPGVEALKKALPNCDVNAVP